MKGYRVKLQKSFDVIVVGAGTGGSIAARFCAKQGLKVCLIDRKPRRRIGDKICGDAVGSDIFNFLDIKPPQGEELSTHIKGAKLYAPNRKKCITLVDPKQVGYIVNRLEFGQRLLKEALDEDISEFMDKTIALNLLYEDDSVSGVKVRDNNGETLDLKSKIVIDASGFYSPLRKKTRAKSLIEKEISDADVILCYREIIKFPKNDQEVKDVEYISIILDQEKAPGGYIWYFPKDEHSLNIGLGVFPHFKGKVKELYKKHVFNSFIETQNYEIISSGGGVAPVRRPLWSCADNGLMLVGDSACQVNPIHGGGIDSSMRAGYYAAINAKSAIDAADTSLDYLWKYNCDIMASFGAEFASLDLLRLVLQNLTNSDINFGLDRDLLSGEEILEITSTGNLNLDIFDYAIKAIKGISKPNLLLDLNFLRIRMEEISKLYQNFPQSRDQFPKWREKVLQIYEKIRKLVINSKNK
ncbi:MAG: geranylgeranyl reductase family protein [Candidatus Lokiarchaeota archaeon]|nr:geranylgeranyl reductase family protein [Candidatus Lokiarchaeota archaeon]MBD3340752.1 geranylgeranyl reductase family protein [Candidatus Lokiarchaeota archaeon]